MKALSFFWSSFIFGLFFFIFLPSGAHADSYSLNNEYTSPRNTQIVWGYYQNAVAIPFKITNPGNFSDFQFQIQPGGYSGGGYSYPLPSVYYDSVSRYPTNQYLPHIKLAILPSNTPSSSSVPSAPYYSNWTSSGQPNNPVALINNPALVDPDASVTNKFYKWLKFTADSGVNLDADNWYWLVVYTDRVPGLDKEWDFVGVRFSADWAKATVNSGSFGMGKWWQNQVLWRGFDGGNYLGFRVGNPGPVVPTKTPVIIIPGIGGSEFKTDGDILSSIYECGKHEIGDLPYFYPQDELIWVNTLRAAGTGCDDYFDVLKLNLDGITSGYPGVVLKGTLFSGTYGKMIEFFKQNGYEENKTLYIFPYDWRKDIALTTPLLDSLIKKIKTDSGSQKVDIVAHSMGGLVARNYIKDPGSASNVRKLITLGTPYLGSVELLKSLMYGMWIDRKVFGIEVRLGVNPEEIKDLFQNFSGGYQLLPSAKYYSFYNGEDNIHPLPFNDIRNIDSNHTNWTLNYLETKDLLTNLGYNTPLYQYGENYHSIDNNLDQTNGVETTTIAGSGMETLGQIIEKYAVDFAGIKIPHRDEVMINGDKTVPLYSAALKDSATGLDFFPSSRRLYVKAEHGSLPNTDNVLDQVKKIIDGDNGLATGFKTTPFLLKGKQVSVHSPVNLHIYDSLGNHTGPTPNGKYEANIPGSSYDTLDDAKFIWLPDDGVYRFKLEATDNGNFDLNIRDYDSDTNTQTTTYQQIPITNLSKVEATFDTVAPTPPTLQMDSNGDGVIEQTIAPTSILIGSQNSDITPPTTGISLSGTQGNNYWLTSDVVVTLNASDDNSGVQKTEYSLDGGTTVQNYSGPITLSQEGVESIVFRSTDNAGNQESLTTREIKIDKTRPRVEIEADPEILWPVNKKMVNVKVKGEAKDKISGIDSKIFQVIDEYGRVEPTLTDFGQVIKLESWRDGKDKDGRVYTIKVKVWDKAGNWREEKTKVVVPHDREDD